MLLTAYNGPKIAPLYAVNNISDTCKYLHYGTGSYPPFEKGLHLKILHKASAPPFRAPYFSTASNPYKEQVGQYGHLVVFIGERYFL